MNSIIGILLIVISSLFFVGCEVGITPLEQKYNEAGIDTSAIVSEEGDVGPIRVEVQEGVNVDDLNVSIEIFGEGSEHFTVVMDKSAAAFIGEITPKPESIVYEDTSYTFMARTIVNGQKLCAKEVQKTILKTEVAPVAEDITVTTDENGSVTFSLKATDKNGDSLRYEIKDNPTSGNLTLNDGKNITFSYDNSEQNKSKVTFTYVAKDERSESNEAMVTINIKNTVKDNTPPVITLNGDANKTVVIDSAYTDAGATAIDEKDGNVTENIEITYLFDKNTQVNNVNTSRIGTYTVTYTVKDNAGNEAEKVIRTVNVVTPFINKRIIKGTSGPVKWLELADFDNNGTLDILTLSTDGNITLYFNEGNNSYTVKNINTLGNSNVIHAGDVNDDGYVDIVYGGEDNLGACFNYTNKTFVCKVMKNSNVFNITSIKTADINRDDLTDIIITQDNNLIVFEKDEKLFAGAPLTFTEKTIDNDLTGATSLDVGNIDKESGIDICAGGDNILKCYFNDGVGGMSQEIKTMDNLVEGKYISIFMVDSYVVSVILANDTYFLSRTVPDSNPMYIDESTKVNNFASAAKFGNTEIATNILSTGIYNDGSSEKWAIMWYEYGLKHNTFEYDKHLIAYIDNPTITQAGDMDNDGLVDVVAGDSKGNIVIYKNNIGLK